MTFPIEPFTRDPLSVAFDRQARLTLSLAIQQHEKHEKNTRLRPYIRVTVPNAGGDGLIRDDTPDRLSKHERAFLRSLYHDDRIHQWTKRQKPGAVWSLKRTWGPVPALPGQPRQLTLEIFRHTSGARHVKQSYKRKEKYAENPAFPGAANPPYAESDLG